MKKLFTLLLALGLVVTLNNNISYAQDDADNAATTEAVADSADTADADTTAAAAAAEPEPIAPPPEPEETTKEPEKIREILKKQFIEGDWRFMGIVLLCLILGLAVCVERIISLNLATTNTNKLLRNVENALQDGDLDRAKEVARSTRGPVASVFYQGLDRANEGIDVVERSIVSYGSVQMGRLNRGLVWIALFIALAPMLGFMGTVIGMIGAFDDIAKAGDISPAIVASGIKVALLTTVFGLIVAIILQIFYNYILAKVDSIVNNMEDASISLVDLINKYKVGRR